MVVENPEPLLEASNNPKITKKAAIIILMGAIEIILFSVFTVIISDFNLMKAW